MQDPLLIIFGAYPGSVANPTLGGPGCPTSGCPLATVGTDYGLTANTATFSSGDAYGTLGLTDNSSGAASESFGNWQNADLLNGFPIPANYALFVFAVPDTLSGGSPINLSENGLAAGSFVIAYSCEDKSTPALGPCTGGVVGASPFTNAGLIDVTEGGGPPPEVPEPSALPVAGIVLGALVTAWRTRKAT
jgi:PEP-CTERM motif-containing protein